MLIIPNVMAIEREDEAIYRLQSGLEHTLSLNMHQEPEIIVDDLRRLIRIGLGDNSGGLQYQHSMGDWREMQIETIGAVLKDHIEPPLSRHKSSFESSYVHPEGRVSFTERKRSSRRIPLIDRGPDVIWGMDIYFDEFHNLGQGMAYHDEYTNTFKTTQIAAKNHHPHRLRIRQVG